MYVAQPATGQLAGSLAARLAALLGNLLCSLLVNLLYSLLVRVFDQQTFPSDCSLLAQLTKTAICAVDMGTHRKMGLSFVDPRVGTTIRETRKITFDFGKTCEKPQL